MEEGTLAEPHHYLRVAGRIQVLTCEGNTEEQHVTGTHFVRNGERDIVTTEIKAKIQ